jgi:hypothetical protein
MSKISGTAALLIVTAIIALYFLLGIRAASADGCEGSYKDCAAVYGDYREKKTRSTRRDREISRYLTTEERRYVEKLKHRVARRKARVGDDEDGFGKRPRRYVERRDVRSDADYRGGDCRPAVNVTGHERLGRKRAMESAQNAWRRSTSDRYGFRFADLDLAKGSPKPRCNIAYVTLTGNKVYICRISARPCQD